MGTESEEVLGIPVTGDCISVAGICLMTVDFSAATADIPISIDNKMPDLKDETNIHLPLEFTCTLAAEQIHQSHGPSGG